MRVLHTSDWHLGRTFHGVDMLDHQRAFVEWLVDLVAEREVELVMVAGDVYDRSVPSLPAVGLWEQALVGLTRTCPVLVVSGNHDSPTRLGFAGPLLSNARVHLRTRLDDIADPLCVTGSDGVQVAVYGVPYLEPELHWQELQVERSHAAVLTAAMERIREDAAARGDVRTIVAAHAFVSGSSAAQVSDSERDVRVGGIGDAPGAIFQGVDYVALGHLHAAQQVDGSDGVIRYAGSPLAFSFSEEAHRKSVTLLDIPQEGPVAIEAIPTPVPRPLATLTGELDALLDDPATRQYVDHWVRVRLTDARRPDNPMGRLREVLPHVVELSFERPDGPAGVASYARPDVIDPLALAEGFVRHVTSTEPEDADRGLLQASVERVRVAQVPR